MYTGSVKDVGGQGNVEWIINAGDKKKKHINYTYTYKY